MSNGGPPAVRLHATRDGFELVLAIAIVPFDSRRIGDFDRRSLMAAFGGNDQHRRGASRRRWHLFDLDKRKANRSRYPASRTPSVASRSMRCSPGSVVNIVTSAGQKPSGSKGRSPTATTRCRNGPGCGDADDLRSRCMFINAPPVAPPRFVQAKRRRKEPRLFEQLPRAAVRLRGWLELAGQQSIEVVDRAPETADVIVKRQHLGHERRPDMERRGVTTLFRLARRGAEHRFALELGVA